MSATPVHDWLRPRLAELIRQAELAGFAREVVVQVLDDLITSPPIDEIPAQDTPAG
jgi:hypothetical protein